MSLFSLFDWLAEIVGRQYGISGRPAKSAYPERSAESPGDQQSKVAERTLEAAPKAATPGLGAKLDKEFWETF